MLYIVVPCYNEEAALPMTVDRLEALMTSLVDEGRIDDASRIALVDDGSRDATWSVIERRVTAGSRVEGIKLAHNVGHQNALWAGMETVRSRCDALVSIDADLQDDPEAIRSFLTEYEAGAEIVYGVRSKRATDTPFKRTTAHAFYRLMGTLGVETVPDHADYRLIGRAALDALMQYGEVNLFLRGMVPTLGFRTATVYYERAARVAGESKYPLTKMLAFAFQGITSFSIKPIRYITVTGALFALIAVIMALYVLISRIAGHTVAGWTSLMLSVWLIGGVQLMAIGLIGEYIGKVYLETKHRPRYIVEIERRPD